MSEIEMLAAIMPKIFYEFLCGALVGIERERSRAPAGLKIQILICVGSALFTVMGQLLEPGTEATARVVAQVVTGVGFLGAGAIIHNTESHITGLTTAAWIWLISSLGVFCGLGHGPLAAFITVLLIAVTIGAKKIETEFLRRRGLTDPKADARTPIDPNC